MTRKDYVAIAGAFKRVRKHDMVPAHGTMTGGEVYNALLGEVMNVLKADNGTFDRDRFKAYVQSD